MSIAEQLESIPPHFNIDEPGGPVYFENPSDTIFAGLFLPVLTPTASGYRSMNALDTDSENSSIPWQFCDRILSAIRDPQFNPKKISFRDCGDMFRAVGRRRHDKWLAVEARPTCNAAFPMAILDGVLDIFREEVAMQAHIERKHFFGHIRVWTTGRDYEWDTTKATLQTMMLVHSSWHAAAKRLVGYRIASSQGPAPSFLQNPLFGRWTREIFLSYHDESDEGFEASNRITSRTYTIEPGNRNGYFLSTLCTCVPNIRLVHLYLADFSDTGLEFLCKAISSLIRLEELRMEVPRMCRKFSLRAIVTAISKRRFPSLRNLRFNTAFFNFDRDKPCILLCHLECLEMLHSIQFFNTHRTGLGDVHLMMNGIRSLTWSRNPSNRADPFALNDVQIDSIAEYDLWDTNYRGRRIEDGMIEVFQTAKLVRIHVENKTHDLGDNSLSAPISTPSDFTHLMAPWLVNCSSAHTLVIRGIPWTRMNIFREFREILSAPASIKKLIIEVISLPKPHPFRTWDDATEEEEEEAMTQFSGNDAELSQMVVVDFFPGLRALDVIFPGTRLVHFVGDLNCEDAEEIDFGDLGVEERRMLLPRCNEACFQKSVEFNVDII
ncbi:hypothetical protein SCHPADRAFT_994033 [Schizopora paradoxa]|uniref:Uncharacterized protein n=1 Tax=Schizopora paradoxa TaxID=27342 RepID=A0A0H2S876_9AGAM|nr:hypothetical protein SCHPADRAFT_994033 [Schizopora paradoxa]